MRCLCLIGCLLGGLLAGCSSPYEPHETVTVKLSGVSSERQEERIGDKLKGMTDGSGSWMSTTRWGESLTIKLAPVTDVQAFSEQIEFGKVTDVSGRTVTVDADAPPSTGNRATQTSPDSKVTGATLAKEQERVDDAIDSATGETLDLHWLQTLDAATTDKLTQWGSGESSRRALRLNGVRTLDTATAEKLAQWGSGEAGERWLDLSGLQTLDAATADKLAQWGSGDAGNRSLCLTDVKTPDAATAEKLVQWGSGEASSRKLRLNIRTLNAATAEKLAQWGSGESGRRILRLRGSARRAVDAAGPPPPAAEQAQPAPQQAQRTAEEQSAIAEIEKLGGTITVEASSAKPVIGVNFGDTEITDAELPHLQGLTQLQSLNITNTGVTDAGLEHLQGFTELRALLVRGTEVTDAGVESLRTALPNVHVLGHLDPAEGATKGTDDLDPETHVAISTCDELQAMQHDLAGHYVLVNDIDCSDVDFEPVGSEESPFTGTLDGQGFVISGLSIDRPSDDLVGLFRLARSATIRNLELWRPVVTGQQQVGALFGRVIDSTVRNVHVGDGQISGRDNIGGLTGRSDDSSIEQVSTSGVVRGNPDTSNKSQFFGGLIGYSLGTSLLRSHSSADVQGKSGWKIGGLVGQLSRGLLSECFATGQVDGWARVGGLAGHVQGSSEVISDCYARGAVNGSQQVGGFVGLTYQGPTITRSYATGAVTGRTDTGGFVGRVLGGMLSACFWDVSTSGQSGDNARTGTTGLSTAVMQTAKTFNSAGWDLEGTGG